MKTLWLGLAKLLVPASKQPMVISTQANVILRCFPSSTVLCYHIWDILATIVLNVFIVVVF